MLIDEGAINMDLQFTVTTVVIVLILFGAATVYAQKIDKYLDKKYVQKQKAVQEILKRPEPKPNSRTIKSNKKLLK